MKFILFNKKDVHVKFRQYKCSSYTQAGRGQEKP